MCIICIGIERAKEMHAADPFTDDGLENYCTGFIAALMLADPRITPEGGTAAVLDMMERINPGVFKEREQGRAN